MKDRGREGEECHRQRGWRGAADTHAGAGSETCVLSRPTGAALLLPPAPACLPQCEVDLRTTASHCGACKQACNVDNGTPDCVGSICTVWSCDTGKLVRQAELGFPRGGRVEWQ